MGGTPKVSVIISAYGAGSHLKECLDSVVAQTLEDIEIICVDEGFTDSSLTVLREYEKRDTRVVVLAQRYEGTGAVRNRGLAAAKGEYLSIMDAGDVFERNTLQTAYQAALEADADVVVYGSTNSDWVKYELLPRQKCFASTEIPQKAFHAVVEHTSDKLFKRTFIQECGLEFQGMRAYHDLFFTYAAWASAQRITVIKDVLIHHRKKHETSPLKNSREWWCIFDALYALKEYLDTHGLYERFFTDYINYAVHLMLSNSSRLEGKARQDFYRYMREDWMGHLGFFEARDDMFYDREELEACKQIMYSGGAKDIEKFRSGRPAPVKRTYDYYLHLPMEKYEEELKIWYKRTTGENLDLENPKTFNEKIQWLKLYDSTPLKTRLADKYLVRDWVKEKIGEEHLIPLLGVWDSFDEIDFDKLPDQFVLKANHGSGWNIVVTDKAKLDIDAAREKFNQWLQTNFAFKFGLELQYMNIQPKIIAEKYMEEMSDLWDYKLMCFGGKVKFIYVVTERYLTGPGHSKKKTLFTRNWERIPARMGNAPADYDIPRPKTLEQMIHFAEMLSQGFAAVRVDLYEVSGQVYFGELTFTSDSGVVKIIPEEFKYEMGSWIQLPRKSPFPKRIF